jgi:pyruvate,water dikinase
LVLLTGTPASPGRAAGEAKVIADLDDFDRFGEGDVLVCRATSPAWMPLLTRAAAVVTEVGGVLAHAAILARELGIPAVVAAEDAMSLLADAGAVEVDGDAGVVRDA